MSEIKAIDKQSVHRICSGQVVVSMAIAGKELIENSLDAGALTIEIRLKEYGLDVIEVTDNGVGVEPSQYRALTLKHYTSKLSEFADLASIATFGFRGEALSSLCALSDVEISTRTKDQDAGSFLVYNANGEITSQEPCARECGTTVSLKNLFSHWPVRFKEIQKNLKREYGKLITLIQAYCLVRPDVRFTVYNQVGTGNKTAVLSTGGNKALRDNIIAVFGVKQVQTIQPFVQKITGSEDIKLEGFVSKPDLGAGRSTGDRQYLSINKRPCDLPKVIKAINEIYHQYNRHQYPFVILDITLPQQTCDVNITPDKRSVLLHEESVLIDLVKASLLELYEPSKGSFVMASSAISFARKVDLSEEKKKNSKGGTNATVSDLATTLSPDASMTSSSSRTSSSKRKSEEMLTATEDCRYGTDGVPTEGCRYGTDGVLDTAEVHLLDEDMAARCVDREGQEMSSSLLTDDAEFSKHDDGFPGENGRKEEPAQILEGPFKKHQVDVTEKNCFELEVQCSRL